MSQRCVSLVTCCSDEALLLPIYHRPLTINTSLCTPSDVPKRHHTPYLHLHPQYYQIPQTALHRYKMVNFKTNTTKLRHHIDESDDEDYEMGSSPETPPPEDTPVRASFLLPQVLHPVILTTNNVWAAPVVTRSELAKAEHSASLRNLKHLEESGSKLVMRKPTTVPQKPTAPRRKIDKTPAVWDFSDISNEAEQLKPQAFVQSGSVEKKKRPAALGLPPVDAKKITAAINPASSSRSRPTLKVKTGHEVTGPGSWSSKTLRAEMVALRGGHSPMLQRRNAIVGPIDIALRSV